MNLSGTERVIVFAVGVVIGLVLVWVMLGGRLKEAARDQRPDDLTKLLEAYAPTGRPMGDVFVRAERSRLGPDGSRYRLALLLNENARQAVILDERILPAGGADSPPERTGWAAYRAGRLETRLANGRDTAELSAYVRERGGVLRRPAPEVGWYVVAVELPSFEAEPGAILDAYLDLFRALEAGDGPAAGVRPMIIEKAGKPVALSGE